MYGLGVPISAAKPCPSPSAHALARVRDSKRSAALIVSGSSACGGEDFEGIVNGAVDGEESQPDEGAGDGLLDGGGNAPSSDPEASSSSSSSSSSLVSLALSEEFSSLLPSGRARLVTDELRTSSSRDPHTFVSSPSMPTITRDFAVPTVGPRATAKKALATP